MKRIKQFFAQKRLELRVLFQSQGYSVKSFQLLKKGQLPQYEILQLSHRLEKGMLVAMPKPWWGWEKAERIAFLIQNNEDEFSNLTGKGVLKAYIEAKKKSDNYKERDRIVKFADAHPEICEAKTPGGVMLLDWETFSDSQKEVIEHFFNSRHSCREFKNRIVAKDDIEAAVALALRCPSACNRQVTNCYVYQSKDLQTIILTTSIRAYDMGEFNDWFISPSIFAGYLSLSLHLYGIGSCVYRKQLYGKHSYNESMRKKCNIPKDEIIICELRFGYYQDKIKVPVSNRHQANDIITFVEE